MRSGRYYELEALEIRRLMHESYGRCLAASPGATRNSAPKSKGVRLG
jgi:hypothetical protein